MKKTGRYEVKFILEEERAAAIANYVRAFMEPSPYNRSGVIFGHPIISLYLDSPDYFLMRQVECGHKNRMKLRIRFYDEFWDHPAFLEVKRRVNDNIVKDRAVISREAVRKFLKTGWPNPSNWPAPDHIENGMEQFDVYYAFWKYCHALKAKPVLYVSYIREVYISPVDSELRVTFDRQIAGTPYDEKTMLDEELGRLIAPRHGIPAPTGNPPYCFPKDVVVLELKFTDRSPIWMSELARIFNLDRRSVCKYASLIGGMRLHWGQLPLPEQNFPLMLYAID